MTDKEQFQYEIGHRDGYKEGYAKAMEDAKHCFQSFQGTPLFEIKSKDISSTIKVNVENGIVVSATIIR